MPEENKTQAKQAEVTELDKLKQERDEFLAGWQRAKADFLNYQKAEQERMTQMIGFANENLLTDILLVLDSFDLAILNTKDENEKKNFELLQLQLWNILKKNGLEEIRTEKGEVFDPSRQEVVEAVVNSEVPPNTITEVVNRGYKLNGKIIRATRVKVSK